MTPAAIERVFGRARLKMVTGQYVDVFREQAAPGERRRYTKRFLSTTEGDFREWTEREWRILARLVGHGVRVVPDVVQFDRGSNGGTALVQTYDAGVTIDHCETLLPVERDGRVLRHVFQDCAHWWALAHHFLSALKEIHQLQLVHLDIKADNVCIPLAPPTFSPQAAGQALFPVFKQLALIDFAFSLVSGERLTKPLPIGWQQEYPYQSPRLLKALLAGRNGDLEPTRELDWRCDMYSLAAMLKRYLPAPERARGSTAAGGWTDDRYVEAKVLILKIRDCHDRDASESLPHQKLIELSGVQLRESDLAESLERGWALAADSSAAEATAPTVPLTPVTRIEPQIRPITLVDEVVIAAAARPPSAPDPGSGPDSGTALAATAPQGRRLRRALLYAIPVIAVIGSLPFIDDAMRSTTDARQPVADAGRPAAGAAGPAAGRNELPQAPQAAPEAAPPRSAPAQDAAPEVPKPVAPDSRSAGDAARVPPDARPRAATDEVRAPPARIAPDEFTRRADDIVSNTLPALADRTARRVAQVLLVAANAEAGSQDKKILETARSIGEIPNAPTDSESNAPSRARQLNAAAREAFWTRRDVAGALELQLRAFGANPQNPEIAGNLAFYYLKMSPPQPEIARQFALYALAAATARSGSARLEDWGNLAVASSLSGRQQDATNAMFVMLAVSRDLNRTCRSALSAFASHGQRMKAPSEAMLARIQSRGGAPEAPHCAWPPNWAAGMKFP